MSLYAGALRHRVSLLERSSGQDSVGQPSENFTPFGSDWAAVEQTGGREFFNAQHFVDETDVVLRMRYRSDLKATHRIAVPARSQTYEVLAVADPTMRKRELYILARMVRT